MATLDPNSELDQLASDGDEDDQYRLYCNPARASKPSRTRVQNTATWTAWVESNIDRLKQPAHTAATTDEELGGPKRVIHSPREYQLELFERAKAKNTIVVLETGSGKTLIAALLIRHVLEQELESREAGNAHRTAFFLVDKVSLVDQQYEVLCCNLDYPVARFCGDNARWSKGSWKAVFESNMVIVCTAAILQKCLAAAFIRMSEINLLIFDEAHHAKKNHVYARIVHDHYITELDPQTRPRLLGMTASPVDAKEDIWPAAMRLEHNLHSEIVTASPDALARARMDCTSTEEQSLFEALQRPLTTALHSKLETLLFRLSNFKRLAEFAISASSQLGRWCSDRFWHLCLTNVDLRTIGARYERDQNRFVDALSLRANQGNIAITVEEVLQSNPLPPVERSNKHLSSKVLSLVSILEHSFMEAGVHRCIVFVEMKYTALVLHELLKEATICIPGLKSAILLGGDSGEVSAVRMSRAAQTAVICKFRRGDFNCLFATSVAEEGIDIPDCDLIIRFDLYSSMIQYVQSKGRARHQRSRYINMVEMGNRDHQRRIMQARMDAQSLQRFCSKLPEERRVDGFDLDLEDRLILVDSNHKQLIIPETGAKLTYQLSLDVLAAFVASLPHPADFSARAEYIISSHGSKFICEVLLPENSPVRSKAGKPQNRRREAKCSAAFELCSELIARKYIDSHLQPIFAKKVLAMQNARLAVSSAKKADYHMIMKPAIWSNLGRSKELYAVALVLSNPEAVGAACTPLILLTRDRLPSIPTFPLYLDNHQVSPLQLVPMAGGKIFHLTDEELDSILVFTLQIFSDVFSKVYGAVASQLPYFFAPSAFSHRDILAHAGDEYVPIGWDDVQKTVLHKTQGNFPVYRDMPDDFFVDRFVSDPFNGSRKFYTKGVAKDLRPQSPAPSWPSAKPKKEGTDGSILAFSCGRKPSAKAARQFSPDQPVVEAEVASLRRNMLAENIEAEKLAFQCFIVLEPLSVSPLSAMVARMAFTLPSVIHRLESCMISLDACNVLGLTIDTGLALQAMTKDSDNTGDHGVEQIDFQLGMGINYERLEFLGDTFLKMATTISLFTLMPEGVENDYHVERMLLVCNRNLFNKAVDRNLQEFIRSAQFDRRSWYPSGLKLVKGKTQKDNYTHKLSDKTIADMCEAVIGAAYVTHAVGAQGLDMAVKAVTAVVKGKYHRQTAFADYFAQYRAPAWQLGPFTAAHRDLAEQLKRTAGYGFESPALARSAFKHPSYPYDSVPHYQRLECLGDALFDMVCVDYLYRHFPDADPQWLTEHKMAMVSNQFLACLAIQLGFHKHLLTTSQILLSQIRDYAQALAFARAEAADRQARARNGSRDEPAKPDEGDEVDGPVTAHSYWLRASDAPKALSDVVEAFLGAVFVDSHYDFAHIHHFFAAHVQPFFADMTPYDTFSRNHPVTALSHQLQARYGCTSVRLMISEIPAQPAAFAGAAGSAPRVVCGIILHNRVVADATAASGRAAKTDAARTVLRKLGHLGRDAFRREVGCDCGDEARVTGG